MDPFEGSPPCVWNVAEAALKVQSSTLAERLTKRRTIQGFGDGFWDELDREMESKTEVPVVPLSEEQVEHLQARYDAGCFVSYTHHGVDADDIQKLYDTMDIPHDMSPQYDPRVPHETLRSFLGIADDDALLFDDTCKMYDDDLDVMLDGDHDVAWWTEKIEGFSTRRPLKLGKDGRPEITLENKHSLCPTFVHELRNHPYKDELYAAMKKETTTLGRYATFEELMERPAGKRLITLRWVFDIKFKNGVFERFKARLVGRGFTQIEGVDYDPEGTSSPVARNSTFFAIMAEAAKQGMLLKSFDVKSAYLLADLTDDVYARLPFGMTVDPETKCLKIMKSLYGLKQSGYNWFSKLSKDLVNIGFVQSEVDPCFFNLERENGDKCRIAIWVDDGLVSVSSEELWQEIKSKIHKENPLSAAGPLEWLLGMAIEQDSVEGKVRISQSTRIGALLERYKMDRCHGKSTPLPYGEKISSADRPETPIEEQAVADACGFEKYEDLVHCMREIIGALGYLTCWGRPDIRYATYFMARFQARPTARHYELVKHILRYLRKTKDLCLVFSPENSVADLNTLRMGDDYPLYGLVDSNYTGADDTRSTSGYIFYFYGCPIVCESKKQKATSHSTTEAELIAASEATKRCLYLRRLLTKDFKLVLEATPLGEDNQGCIDHGRGGGRHARMRHLDVAASYVQQECKLNKTINLRYVASADNVSDIFTKALGPLIFVRLRNRLMGDVVNETVRDAEEY